MPMHSKAKKNHSVGVELRAGGDPHRSEKPGWSAGDMRQWPKQKNAQASGFSYGSFAVSFLDLFKVSKITTFLTCSKSPKILKSSHQRSSHIIFLMVFAYFSILLFLVVQSGAPWETFPSNSQFLWGVKLGHVLFTFVFIKQIC